MQRILSTMLALLVFGAASAQITVWTTENQPDRMDVQNRIAAQCEVTTGVSAEFIPLHEDLMGERVTAAFASGSLPDVIFQPPYHTLSWAEAGILDTQAASEVIENLGADTFTASALETVAFNGEYAAIPVSGFPMLVLYREDLFSEAGLEPPTSFDAIRAVIEELHDPPNLYAVAVGTDPSNVIMSQHLEFLLNANGVTLFDANGEFDIDDAKAIEVLEFYKELVEASPPGNLYSTSIRDLYLTGQIAMTFWASFILDELAGLRNDAPVLAFENEPPTTSALAENTAIRSTMVGPSGTEPTGWADVVHFGITVDADTDAAQRFVECAMSDQYVTWLSMATEGAFPVRTGPEAGSNVYVEEWAALPMGVDRREPMGNLYSEEAVGYIQTSLENSRRWGYEENQGLLVSRILGTRVLTETVRQFLDGEHTAEETVQLLEQRIRDIE